MADYRDTGTGVNHIEFGNAGSGRIQRVTTDNPLPVAGGVVVASAEIVSASAGAAYVANDVISASAATKTTPTPLVLALRDGQALLITKARVITNNVLTLVNFRLAVYTTDPTGANVIPVDNAPWTMLYGNATNRQATIEMPIATTGGSGSDSAASMYVGAPVPVKCASGTKSLLFVLIAGAGFTPTSGQKFTLEVTAQTID